MPEPLHNIESVSASPAVPEIPGAPASKGTGFSPCIQDPQADGASAPEGNAGAPSSPHTAATHTGNSNGAPGSAPSLHSQALHKRAFVGGVAEHLRSKSTIRRPEPALRAIAADPNDPTVIRLFAPEDQVQAAAKIPTRLQILRNHFFRRFFDNDTITLDGDTQTAVIRAIAFCAVPQFMFTFWLLPHYPLRPFWEVAADRYFQVLFSLVAMGTVAAFEWEMLFPDRADFQVLLPLPLKARELFLAKFSALLLFLGIFLAATNLFCLIAYPALSTRHLVPLLHAIYAHTIAVLLAGIFAALTTLAVAGVLIALLPSRWFRPISTAMQSLSITVLLLFFLLYPLVANNLPTLLTSDTHFAPYIPPLWFLALYEKLFLGSDAPPACGHLAAIGLYAIGIAAVLCLVTYPLGWARQKKRALEGIPAAPRQSRSLLAALLHRTLLKRPQESAVFHFLIQTLARSPRYHLYFAAYSAAGLAIALCCIVGAKHIPSGGLVLTLSPWGLHALLPLLLFWLAAGLRAAFSFPVDMHARWIFPIALRFTHPSDSYPAPYGYPGRAAKAARTFTLLCCASLAIAILALLAALGATPISLLVQAICAIGISLLLADLLFTGRTQIPFTRPRLPGRTNLTIVFALYAAIFPATILTTVQIELAAEQHPLLLLRIAITFAAAHLVLIAFDRFAQRGIIGGFPEDESDDGPVTLGLTQ